MRRVGRYCVDDPRLIQGRDDVSPVGLNLGALRLRHALAALDRTTGRVLVPGCGAGRYVRALARARPDLWIVGGDLSRRAIREAYERDPTGRYVVFDACRLPFRDETFDAVVFLDVLEHVPQPAAMIEECARVLRPGGILHAFVPLEAQPGTLYWLLRASERWPIHRWKRDHVGHIQRFSDIDVLRLLAKAGFEVRALGYSFHLIGQLHDLLDYWQRERAAGAPGRLPIGLVRLVTRVAFVFTWRAAALEDRVFRGRTLAAGLHVTAYKPTEREHADVGAGAMRVGS
ncbi:MAG: class I SAM-dependent methyltransferase [Thermomicrobium sp.]|nr:class I SAM-dependent methyltransferase [Thermomicrobium sp.]